MSRKNALQTAKAIIISAIEYNEGLIPYINTLEPNEKNGIEKTLQNFSWLDIVRGVTEGKQHLESILPLINKALTDEESNQENHVLLQLMINLKMKIEQNKYIIDDEITEKERKDKALAKIAKHGKKNSVSASVSVNQLREIFEQKNDEIYHNLMNTEVGIYKQILLLLENVQNDFEQKFFNFYDIKIEKKFSNQMKVFLYTPIIIQNDKFKKNTDKQIKKFLMLENERNKLIKDINVILKEFNHTDTENISIGPEDVIVSDNTIQAVEVMQQFNNMTLPLQRDANYDDITKQFELKYNELQKNDILEQSYRDLLELKMKLDRLKKKLNNHNEKINHEELDKKSKTEIQKNRTKNANVKNVQDTTEATISAANQLQIKKLPSSLAGQESATTVIIQTNQHAENTKNLATSSSEPENEYHQLQKELEEIRKELANIIQNKQIQHKQKHEKSKQEIVSDQDQDQEKENKIIYIDDKTIEKNYNELDALFSVLTKEYPYDNAVALVKRLGGVVTETKGSHRCITFFNQQVRFIANDPIPHEAAYEKNSGICKPHGSSHDNRLRNYNLTLFRQAIKEALPENWREIGNQNKNEQENLNVSSSSSSSSILPVYKKQKQKQLEKTLANVTTNNNNIPNNINAGLPEALIKYTKPNC